MFSSRRLMLGASGGSSSFPTNNIFARYDGADLSGSIVADSSGNGNDINVLGAPSQIAETHGTGLDFTPNDGLLLANAYTGASPEVAISAHVTPDQNAGSSVMYPMGLELSSTNAKVYWIVGHPSSAYRNNVYVLSDDAVETRFSAPAMTIGTEYILTIRIVSGVVYAYIDGVLVNSATINGTWSGGNTLSYGFGGAVSSGAQSAPWDGVVQLGYVYRGPISAADVATLATGV